MVDLTFFISDGEIILHGRVTKGHKKDGDYSGAIRSCLVTRFHLTDKKAQNEFWKRLPPKFEEYKQVTIANGDRIRAASHQGQVEEDTDQRDATFVRVSDITFFIRPGIQLNSCSTHCLGTYTSTCQARDLCSGPPSTLDNSTRSSSQNYHPVLSHPLPSPRELFSQSSVQRKRQLRPPWVSPIIPNMSRQHRGPSTSTRSCASLVESRTEAGGRLLIAAGTWHEQILLNSL
jgi:hypothetical protein